MCIRDRIRNGATVSVALAGSPEKFSGRVVTVLDQLQPGTTNFTVKVLVPNPDGRLRAGMPVTAQVSLPPVSGVAIPTTAFVDDTRASVYVVSNGVVKTTTVHEVKDDGKTAIVSGIADGTVVVKDVESSNVGNGDKVSTAAAPAK